MSCLWPKSYSAKCSQVIDISSNGKQLNDMLIETIDCHYFSQEIQLITTNQGLNEVIDEYITTTNTLSYYLVKNIPIYVFIDKILINGFVKKGKLFGLSINKEIDFDDCFALLPNGLILLSLKESTYHRLGIIGKKSILYRNKSYVKKYLIEIDLNNKHLTPGTKYYRRTHECLQRCGLLFDIIIKWEVNEELISESIAPMSIKNFFNYIKSKSNDCDLDLMQWFRCSPSLTKFTNNYVPIPKVNHEFVAEDVKSIIDWFGTQICQIDCESSQELDVSTFVFNHIEERRDVSCVVLNGFFTSFDVKRLVNKLNERIFNSGISAIIVNGFEDTPIGWKGKNNEHGKSLTGENLYGFANKLDFSFIWRIADEYDFGIERL